MREKLTTTTRIVRVQGLHQTQNRNTAAKTVKKTAFLKIITSTVTHLVSNGQILDITVLANTEN